ncbi:WD40/YVTN/BNR-like repeat-containing protein [Flavilitoribacter nigricans]|uniref:Photosynthesis system II assembly factor Ycf48/Hcf136-like domain-containing protein n=1 Tax=Flavilitoribacter nigricans (strain ATCC 23147 / DSM 23189 / NBRC 102662 / NCIMB 1420 / SS-2) TaxID=1122177 RepID=A0A2D0NHM6_FLAN2|nr:hypothetical protein [Flavilitoribacter nigricans]PHN07981.1 hypothetical protein CRP01_04295 [Flavilitoribacter nigricans DSM 23189 = NBRC 102662]
MKNTLLFLMLISLLFSCRKTTETPLDMPDTEDICRHREALFSPQGYEIESIGTLDFNGGMDAFRMLDQQTGYALASNNVGGYAEVFKTENGGISWTNLEVNIPFRPLAMVFRDTDYGLITVNDRTGCDGTDCLSRTVAFRTENGGTTWERIEYLKYRGCSPIWFTMMTAFFMPI